MSAKRVLLLGTCGIEKAEVAQRIKRWCEAMHHQELRVLDFEKDHLLEAIQKPYRSFLKEPRPLDQFDQWRKGWARLALAEGLPSVGGGKRRKPPPVPELLLLHGAIVNGQYGVRAVYDLDSVARHQPDLIITLIDDVYDTWWRTEQRARGHPQRGRPTLEQLLLARRVEQLVGDQIANHISPPSWHVVLSVHHPTECAARLILGDPRLIYMAFPISEPRRMLDPRPPKEPSSRGIEAVNRFHKTAYDFQKDRPDTVFVSPVAIDERPLSDILEKPARLEELVVSIAVENSKKEFPGVKFPRDELRWPTGDYWKEPDVLCPGRPAESPLFLQQLQDAAGAIKPDVAWRDYRLVLQANSLAVFNPVMNNRHKVSGGVQNEIEFAALTDKRVYVYQEEEEDTAGHFKDHYFRAQSSMGDSPITDVIELCSSVENMLEKASSPDA